MRRWTACAVRARLRLSVARRYVHCETTSRSVWGAYQCAETQDLPCQGTSGASQEKRPNLQPFVLATLCVDRAVPLGGQPKDGQASDKRLQPALRSAIAPLLARPGVAPGASSSMADAALVTEAKRAALGDPLVLTR